MKFIQTLWIPDGENPVCHRAGWLSAEFHWMSWALSCHLLKRHYTQVELYTTSAGKDWLIGQLKLPYSQTCLLPTYIAVQTTTWALAKLLTYQVQTEPFLHVDSDVYIWKPFQKDFLESPLIAQNAETDKTIYQLALQTLAQKAGIHFPPFIYANDHTATWAYNAGILGGFDIGFLSEYARYVIDYVQSQPVPHPEQIGRIPYCMLFEQHLLAQQVASNLKEVTSLFTTPVNDIAYVGFDGYCQMKPKGYWHLMGRFKQDRDNLKMMSAELRAIAPATYYAILKAVAAAGIELDFKVYQLPALDPQRHSAEYFTSLAASFDADYTLAEPIDWVHYYVKDSLIHQQLSQWIDLDKTLSYRQLLVVNHDFLLLEETQPTLRQHIRFPDTCTLDYVTIELDNLTMIVLDAISDGPITIEQLLAVVAPYFPPAEAGQHQALLLELIEQRVQKLLFWGTIRWMGSD